ncbi:unnamed protein product [Rhodiola kirilowii]
MKEEETITEFNTRIHDISNESFALGEPISEERLVRKALRSLPQQFSMKEIAIKEVHDVMKMGLDELMGSLQTFELKLQEDVPEKKVRVVGLKAKVTRDQENEKDMSEYLVMLTTNFVKGETSKGIKCKECGGFRHVQDECAKTVRKNNKSFAAN